MADKYLSLDKTDGNIKEVEGIINSGGIVSAGKIIATDSAGRIDMTLMPVGVGNDARIMEASEDLVAPCQVNIHYDAGVSKARKADASNGRRTHGYVVVDVTEGNLVTVYMEGTIASYTDLIPGTDYFLSDVTPGGIVGAANLPSTASYIVQRVGWAISTTELSFEPETPIVLA